MGWDHFSWRVTTSSKMAPKRPISCNFGQMYPIVLPFIWATAALPAAGQTIQGGAVQIEPAAKGEAGPPTRKNKSRVGGKFSKLKASGGTAFHGSSNQF